MPEGNVADPALNDLDVLLPAIAAGNEGAFARWLAGAEAPVRASLRRFAGSVDTEAVLQEALLRVWQVAPRLRSDGHPNGLLRLALVVTRNLAISETRRRAREVPLPDPNDLPSDPAPGFSDPILKGAIARCMDKLPFKPKQAFAARIADGGLRSDRELAEELGLKLNTFLQNVTRARRLLAACLDRAGVRLGRPEARQ